MDYKIDHISIFLPVINWPTSPKSTVPFNKPLIQCGPRSYSIFPVVFHSIDGGKTTQWNPIKNLVTEKQTVDWHDFYYTFSFRVLDASVLEDILLHYRKQKKKLPDMATRKKSLGFAGFFFTDKEGNENNNPFINPPQPL